jgi:hypothetical protein
MAKPQLRTKSIGTKVTDEEYDQLVALAGDQSVSEWVRDVLLKATRSGPSSERTEPHMGAAVQTSQDTTRKDASGVTDDVLLGEVLGLRTIVLNVVSALGRGETLTDQLMRQIIDRADADKLKKATERRETARWER